MYVIKKGSLYVSKPGMKSSYTKKLEHAVKYQTKEAAAQNRCPENETVVPLFGKFYR